MYYDFKVKIPEVKGKIYERTIKGVVYINYEYDRIYKPDKKYNISKRTTIGKKCEDDPEMMYPNPNFLTYFPDAELPEDQGRDARSSCLRIGTWIVIEIKQHGGMGQEKSCGYLLFRENHESSKNPPFIVTKTKPAKHHALTGRNNKCMF